MSIKTKGSLARRDVCLTFGKTNTLSTSNGPFGYSASTTDGTFIDTGKNDLEGAGIIVELDTAITASGSPTATTVVITLSGSSDSGSTWAQIEKWERPSSDFAVGSPVMLGIPRGYADKPLLKLEAKVVFTGGTTPAVTAGKLNAFIDAYGAC